MSTPIPEWTHDMRETMRNLQRQTVTLTLPVMAVAGLLMLLLAIRSPQVVWGMVMAFLLFAMIPLIWQVSKISFPAAAGLLIVGSWILIWAVAIIWKMESALYLLIVPVGLASMTLGTRPGAGVILLNAAALLFPPAFVNFLSPSTPVTILLSMLLTWGMVWLTLYPLLTSVSWAWTSYRNSLTALNQAQEFQVKLQQSLEDIKLVTAQLKRQNKLAQGLRSVAEEERRAKQEFVANVSHELRTPLNMIIGFSSNILGAPELYGENVPPKLLSDLQVILRNSQHLSDLIDDVLDLSQMDANRMVLNKELVLVSDIIQSAVQAVRPLYESKNLHLEVDVPDTLPPLWCDQTRIREVLLNLISNAARFTEQGGVHVKAVVENDDLVVSIRDTGMGISEENQRKLFEPFQQADGSIRRKYGGTGLGLSISKGFVELHNGKMWVESRLGEGTTFYFRLPISEPVIVMPNASRWFNPYLSYDDVRHVAKLPDLDERPRLGIVEPGTVLQKLVRRHTAGLNVVSFPSLDAALQDISEFGAQGLLVNQPHLEAVLDQLTTLPEGIPAMVCSLPDKEQDAGLLQVVDYLVKPVSRDTLLKSVAALGKPIESILVVDDEPEMRQLYRRILASNGENVRVLRAGDGQEALEILSHEKVDLILLDMVMPRMDGLQFLQERENLPNVRDIPVILISGRDREGQPIASNALAITRGGGLSASQLMACLNALLNVLSPLEEQNDSTRSG